MRYQAALAALSALLAFPGFRPMEFHTKSPKGPKVQTEFDLERIRKAEEKRQRKQAKRLAIAKREDA